MDRNTQSKPRVKTNQHHQLCASLAASLVFIATANHLHGAVNTFTNREAWSAAVYTAGARWTTIFGFNFYPPNPRPAAISNQFAGAGFEFLAQDGEFPITIGETTNGILSTPLRPNTGQTIRWRFTTPIKAVGWERASDDDTHVYRIFDVNNVEIGVIDFRTPTRLGGPVFGGFISDVPIGFALSFSDNNDQLHSIDNLRYAAVAESGPLLVISRRNATEAMLNWETNVTGYRLEYAESLAAPTWNAVTDVPTIVSNRAFVPLTNTGGYQRYFRLSKP
jgi:hypothetical protein